MGCPHRDTLGQLVTPCAKCHREEVDTLRDQATRLRAQIRVCIIDADGPRPRYRSADGVPQDMPRDVRERFCALRGEGE